MYCGRYVNQHMLAHTDSSGHQMVLSLADISVWCFACDSYIDNHVRLYQYNSVMILWAFVCVGGGGCVPRRKFP